MIVIFAQKLESNINDTNQTNLCKDSSSGYNFAAQILASLRRSVSQGAAPRKTAREKINKALWEEAVFASSHRVFFFIFRRAVFRSEHQPTERLK